MTDPSRYPGTSDPTDSPERASTTGAPRWVQVLGVIALVVAVVFLVLLLVRGPGGGHGPGRHASSAAGGHSASAVATGAATTGSHASPGGGHAWS